MHRPMAGIDGRAETGCFSIVMSGGILSKFILINLHYYVFCIAGMMEMRLYT